jgi:hypothetical protein
LKSPTTYLIICVLVSVKLKNCNNIFDSTKFVLLVFILGIALLVLCTHIQIEKLQVYFVYLKVLCVSNIF